MGMQDRDWYWEEKEKRDAMYHPKEFRRSPNFSSKPKNKSDTHILKITTLWVLVFALVFSLITSFVLS